MTTSPELHATAVPAASDQAPTVVFLHGLFGQGRNFTQIAKELADTYRSVLVDLPNHGRSERTGTTDYRRTADEIAAWLRSTELLGPDAPPVHLVGHSMGGKIAMVLALRHPELVERLVVVDISPVPTPAAGEGGEFAHLLDSLAALDLDTLTSRGGADERLSGPIRNPRVRGFLLQNLQRDDDGFSWRADLALLRRELGVIGGFPDPVTEPPGGTFDGPTLWLAGETSDYVRPEHEPAMRALFPRAFQATIKGAGHWVHSEQPAAFVSALRVFLGAA